MKQRALVIRGLVSLALGAATTVAVAWGLALLGKWGVPQGGDANLSPRGSEVSSVRIHQSWQPGRLLRSVDSDSGRKVVGVFIQTPWEDGVGRVLEREDIDASWGLARLALVEGKEVNGADEARGWPCVALYSFATEVSDPPTRHGGIRVREDPLGFENKFIPLLPIWRGFAVDTCVYAAAWGVVLLLPAGVRRALRRRRGRCPACGYDLHGQDEMGCSECGWNRNSAQEPVDSAHG